MKSHKYWSIGALITMLGTFYTGYKGSKEGHKYFAASTLLHFTELSGRHSVLERPRSEMKRSFIPQSSFKSMARAKAGINAPLTGFQTVDYSNQAEQRIVLLMSIQ